MAKIHPLIIFTGLLVVLLAGSFFAHEFYLNSIKYVFQPSDLLFPYIVNFVLALGITIVLYTLRIKQAHNLGFIFMGSSFLKFAVFFIVFYPMYKQDGDASRLEFAQFFVPYAISLTVETVFLIRILNKMDLLPSK